VPGTSAPAGPERHADARLEHAFREHSHGVFSVALGDAVRAYVAAQKEAGCLVEEIIVGMKHIAQRGLPGPAGYEYSTVAPLCEQNATMQQAVTLCICLFYGVDALPIG
jgi:hypothetical protein